jgi:hypothetical protein
VTHLVTGRRTRRIWLILVVLLFASVLGAVSWHARSRSKPSSIATKSHGASPAGAGPGPLLEQSLNAIAEGERATPRDRWDPSYVADALGPDPTAHVHWVRSRTAWVPYSGVLRGAVGVLLDRQGNSLDRALLLADLLQHAGHTVRLAKAGLSVARAQALLPVLMHERSALARESAVRAEADWRDDIRLATGTFGRDSARIARSIEAGLDSSARMLDTLEARTGVQTARLRDLLPLERGRATDKRDIVAAITDHWWVQRLEEGRWTDLDVTGVADAGNLTPLATFSPSELDPALYQRVVVRLVTERVSSGTLVQQRSLEREIRPSAVVGQPVILEIIPAGWQPGILAAAADPSAEFRKQVLEEREWRVTLTVGGETIEAVISLSRGTAATNSGNPFGGLGQGIAGALDQKSDELSAAWIEYEILGPDRPPQLVRRQLFDLVGPAARMSRGPVHLELDEERRLERSLALLRTTEIVPLGSAVAPEYLLHLTARAALANHNFLRSSGPPAVNTASEAMEAFAKTMVPGPSQLYLLAAIRMVADPDADVFLDQPNVLSRHAFLGLRRGQIVRLEGTDIVANDVAAAPDAADPVQARRRQGVRDTNAEALLYAGRPVVGSVADGFARSERWVAITSAQDALLARLPADIRQRMADDLAAGYLLVAPASIADATRPEMAGWWRTDPRTGQTLGMSGTGWGQVLSERMQKHLVLLSYAVVEAWFFEFLWCARAVGGPASNPVARGGSPMDWLVTPAWASEGEGENAKSACVWESWRSAIAAGLFYKASVVWGLIVKRVTLIRAIRAASSGEGAGAAGGGTPSSGGGPPGGSPRPNAPPPECPPGGGMPRGAAEEPPPVPGGRGTPSEEPGVNPSGRAPTEEGPVARPNEPSPEAAPPRNEPTEPAPRTPAEEPVPFDEAYGDLAPMAPGHYEAQASGWAAREPGAAQVLAQEEAFAREAAEVAERAKQELALTEGRIPAPNSAEARREDFLRSLINRAEYAPQAVARAKAALDRIRALVEQYRRLAALNESLLQARAEAREASEAFARLVRNGEADFESNQYVQWKKVIERYERALKEYAAAYRDLSKIPAAPKPVGGTLPLPSDPVRPGGPQSQCAGASPPPGSPPPGSPPPGSPPPGSPPPSPSADAARRLSEAQRELDAARDEVYKLDHDIEHPDGTRDMGEFTAAERELHAREKQLAAEGKSLGPHDDTYKALLQRKIEAVAKVLKLVDQVKEASAAVRNLERAASPAPAPVGTADAPPQLPVLVGVGGMSAP